VKDWMLDIHELGIAAVDEAGFTIGHDGHRVAGFTGLRFVERQVPV
jgi:hypothetical protein